MNNSNSNQLISGTAGADNIINSGNNVTINAGAGNDTISLRSDISSATINAGTGNDTIYASVNGGNSGGRVFQYALGDGDDVIYGFTSNDVLRIFAETYETERTGDDVIVKVGSGSITIKNAGDMYLNIKAVLKSGTDGADSISNEEHRKILMGLAGNDTITNSGRYVTINAGDGNDVIRNQSSGDYSLIDLGSGDDSIYSADEDGSTIYGGSGNDTFSGNYYSTRIFGGDGNDRISVTGGSSNTVDGGNGDDTIYAYGGSISGGAGNDRISITDGNGGTVNGGTGNDTIIAQGTYGRVYQYASGDGNDIITGFSVNDTLQITSGTYSTSVSGGDLIVSVGTGKITLKDAVANSHYKIRIKGADGALETIKKDGRVFTADADTLDNTAHDESFSTYEGNDTISNSGERVKISADEGNDHIDNFGAYSTIDAGDGNDTVYNNGYNAKIFGGEGNDSIHSWNSYVTVDGGSGNDTIYAYDYASSISGGDGNDSIQIYGSGSEHGTINGGTGDDTIIAQDSYGRIYQYADGDGNDLITGFSANDTLQITSGTYTTEQKGEDFLVKVGNGIVTLKGAATNYGKIRIKGSNNVITVVNSWNVMNGTASADTLSNVANNVTVEGGAGNDKISNTGDKVLVNGGAGNDSIYNSNSYNTISGGDGNDTIQNYGWSTAIYGGAGNDSIQNYGWSTAIYGGAGNDSIYNNSSNVTIDGGAGNDTIHVSYDYYNLINGGAGNDRISLNGSSNSVSTVIGGKGNDTINATGTYGRIYKYYIGDGDDVIYGFSVNDTIHVAAERYSTSVRGSDVVLNIDGGSITLKDAIGKVANVRAILKKGSDSNDTMANFENDLIIDAAAGNDTVTNSGDRASINGGAGNDSISNSGQNVTIDAGDGDDKIYNSGWNSVVDGGSGNDTLIGYGSLAGGAGNDKISVTGGGSTINGGTGNDTIIASATGNLYQYGEGDGNDLITGFSGRDTLQITSGTFSVESLGSDWIITVGNGAVTLKNAIDDEYSKLHMIDETGNDVTINDWSVMEGTDGGDSLTNNADNVTVSGLGGNDSISNSGRYVSVSGGTGNDKIYNNSNGDHSFIDGGDGNDSIYSADEDYSTISGGNGDDTIVGHYWSSSISGGAGNDKISVLGGGSNNTVNAGTGNDTIYSTNVNGVVYEYFNGDGNDVIQGATASDTLKISGGYYTTVKSGNDLIVSVGNGKITVKGGAINIDGTEKPSVNSGTAGADFIENNFSDIIVEGRGGNDSIYNLPNSDNVILDGGEDNDFIQNNYGYNVTLAGGNGNDTIANLRGRNISISGGAGNDSIRTANATVDGTAYYSSGVTINGGAGDDTISLGNSGNLIQFNSGDGNDIITGFSEGDTLQISDSITGASISGADFILNINGGSVTLKDFLSNSTTREINLTDASGKANKISIAEGVIKMDNQISGNDYANSINNDQSGIYINAMGGNDTISNSGDEVTIDGGSGNDVIANIFTSGGDKVSINGGDGNDSIKNDYGDGLTVNGGNGNDTIENIIGHNSLIDGGAGNDVIKLVDDEERGEEATNNTISGGTGDDTIYSAGYENVILYAEGDGNDVIVNFDEENILKLTSGSVDSVSVDGKDAVVTIGTGTITIKNYLDGYNKGRELSWIGADGILNSTSIGGDIVSTINGTAKADNINNEKDYVVIDALAGNDKITNSGDNVTIIGGKGNDKITNSGSANVYKYASGDGKDTIDGFAEDDVLQITSGKYSYSWSKGSLVVKVGTGTITLTNVAENDFITLVDANGKEEKVIPPVAPPEGWAFSNTAGTVVKATIKTATDIDLTEEDEKDRVWGENVETIDGSKATRGLTIIGNELDNSIKGGSASDFIDGGAGDDTILGGNGDDTILGGTGTNVLTGGNGRDVFVYGGGKDLITDYKVGQDSIQVDSSIEIDFDNVVIKGTNAIYNTSEGEITIKGGKSIKDNIIFIDEDGNLRPERPEPPEGWKYSSDRKALIATIASAEDFIDLLEGTDEKGNLYGEGIITVDGSKATGDLTIIGNDLDNSLKGGKGDDTLNGGVGNDTLTGGNGRDVFVYSGGNDLITDYKAGQDTIQIDSSIEIEYSEIKVSGTNTIIKTSEGNLTVKGIKTPQSLVIVNEDGEQLWPIVIPDGWSWDTKSTKKISVTKKNTAVEDIDLTEENEQGIVYGEGVVTVDGTNAANGFSVTGNDENNIVKGGKKDDTLNGGAGNDTLTGGAGNDIFVYNGGVDVITDFTAGQDTIQVDTTAVDWDAFKISTLGTSLVFNFDDGNKLTLQKAKGKDFVIIDEDGEQIYPVPLPELPDGWEYVNDDVVSIKAATDDSDDIDLNENYGENVEYVNGSKVTRDLVVIGNDLGNHIITGSGDDTIESGSGDDTLHGGAGNDAFIFSGGNDVIEDYNTARGEDDMIILDDGVKFESISRNDDDIIIETSNGSLVIADGRGKHLALYDKELNDITPIPTLPAGMGFIEEFDFTGIHIDDPIEFEEEVIDLNDYINVSTVDVSDATFGVKVIGSDENNSIVGSDYDDTIDGGSGDDTMTGGAGADVYVYSGGNDVIEDYNYKQDKDKIQIDTSFIKKKDLSARIDGADVIFSTKEGDLTVRNAKGQSIIFTDEKGSEWRAYPTKLEHYGWKFSNNDTVMTATLASAADVDLNDEYGATVAKVVATKVTRNFTVIGNGLNNTITSGKGADTLKGGDGNDYIDGGAGNDVLFGDDGNDTLKGGAGNDTFVYSGGDDLITDYVYNKTQRDVIMIDTNSIALTSVETVGSNLVYTTTDGDTLTLKNAKKYANDIHIVDIDGDAIDLTDYGVRGANGNAAVPANDSLWFADDNNFISNDAQLDSITEISITDYSITGIDAPDFETLAQSDNTKLAFTSSSNK